MSRPRKLSSMESKQVAEKVVEICIKSKDPMVIAAVTEKPGRYGMMSLDWEYPSKAMTDNCTEDGTAQRDFESENVRKFYTSDGMLGRLHGLAACTAFANGSLVDRMSLFLAMEVNISFVDFRNVFRYIWGVRDVDFCAALREMIIQQIVVVASMRNCDFSYNGPMVLQGMSGREYMMSQFDPQYQNVEGHGTWYNMSGMSPFECDCLLMKCFVYCINDLDDDLDITSRDIKPYQSLYEHYMVQKTTVESCYPYLNELMQIRTREMNMADLTSEWDRIEYPVTNYNMTAVLDQAIRRNQKRIMNAYKKQDNADAYRYLNYDPRTLKSCEETATDEDIDTAIDLLENNLINLRVDSKTGKVINAEKIMLVLNEVPRIFSLKSLYRIFRSFDTDEEVIRRDVRSLAKKGQIVNVGRGLYCSCQYADEHLNRIAVNEEVKKDSIFNKFLETQLGRLEDALELLGETLKDLDD